MKRILLYDVETRPSVVFTWGQKMYDEQVIEVIEPWSILSIAWKWLGEEGVYAQSVQRKKSDKGLLQKFRKILNEADVVVAHNGIQFDNKKIRTRMLKHDIKPFSPVATIDTKQVCSRVFGFTSNRLDDVASFLGVGRKLKHGGFDLWKRVMVDDPIAWKEMLQYNVQDVRLLEKVYTKLRPWIENHHQVNNVGGHRCPKCDSDNVQARGVNISASGTYQRFQCRDCGGWSQARKAYKTHKVVMKLKNAR